MAKYMKRVNQPAASSSSPSLMSVREKRSDGQRRISQETKNEIVTDFIIGCICQFKSGKIC